MADKPKQCRLDDIQDFKDTYPDMYHALETMQAYSALGRQLFDWAKEKDIAFFEADLGFFMGLGGADVSLHTDNSDTINISTLPHEIFHAIQHHEHDFLGRPNDLTSRNFLIYGLCLEAAAVASQLRTMYEMKLNNQPDVWDDFRSNTQMRENPKGEIVPTFDKYQPIADIFEEYFNKSIKAGEPSHIALKDACTAAHQAYFCSAEIKQAYGEVYISRYVSKLNRGAMKGYSEDTPFDPVLAYNMTDTAHGEHLIHKSGVSLPITDEDLFETDDQLRQAYDYLEAARLKKNFGPENPLYLQMMQDMTADQNPYRDLVLEEVAEELRNKPVHLTAFEVLNKMAGLPENDNAEDMQSRFSKNANDNRNTPAYRARYGSNKYRR